MGALRATGIALVAAISLLVVPAAASADEPYPAGPFAPWDGSNPFNCELQDVGTGVAFPDPDADPFCVEYDKTQQNITDFGIFDFAAQEPARLAQAGNKCFYYQSDHWTGSIVQGEPPELWHWDGQYLIDRGLGVAGGNLQNFRILGVPANPAAYFPPPPEFAPYVDQDGIGALLVLNLPFDPACAAKVDTPEERAEIYGPDGPPITPDSGMFGGGPPTGGTLGAIKGSRKAAKKRKCARKKRGGGKARTRCRRKS